MEDSAATFVVRLERSAQGRWSGVVERVRTGEKFRVRDIEAIGQLIAGLLSGQKEQPGEGDAWLRKEPRSPQ